MKLPVPVPSVVRLFAVVGLVLVFQQTPLAVIVPPPSAVIFPPDTAVIEVIEVIAVVVRVARVTWLVENETSLP
jgi:hypothetical protein